MALAFSNVAKPQPYQPAERITKMDFASIPFGEVAEKYRQLMLESRDLHEEANQAARDNYNITASQAYADEYNATHEDQIEAESYEGDYEALNLKEFNWTLGRATQAQFDQFVSEFSKHHSLPKHATWLMPQMLAKFASVPLGPRNADGKYSGSDLSRNMYKDPAIAGAMLLTMFSKRSILVSSQTSPTMRNYCSLVPLVLYAFKLHHNIPYSSWHELKFIVEPNLLDAMSIRMPNASTEVILRLREEALKGKPAESTFMLSPPAGSKLYSIPTLARIMLCQTWCAHPSNRTENMILGFSDWENMPEPLVAHTGLFRD